MNWSWVISTATGSAIGWSVGTLLGVASAWTLGGRRALGAWKAHRERQAAILTGQQKILDALGHQETDRVS